jgi:putative MATE family efflux protein
LDQRDRRILALAVPALGALAIEPVYTLVDTAIIGHLGTAPLGGLALAATVLSGVAWLCNFLTLGITSRVAFLTGQGNHRQAAVVAGSGLWLGAGGGLLLAAVVGTSGRDLALALGGHGAVLAAATTYVRIAALGFPFLLVTLVGHGYLRGLSDTRTPLRVVAASNVLNVVLEVWFVYGLGWGVAGSAWGTVAAQAVGAVWFAVLVTQRATAKGARPRPSLPESVSLLRSGRQLTVRTLAIVAAFTLATAAAAHIGPSTLAGHQIAMQMFLLLALSVDALAVAAQAMVGTSLGGGDGEEASAISIRVLRLGILVGAALGAILVAASPVLPRIFTGDAAVISRATAAVALLGLMQVPAAAAFALDGALMGASDYRYLQWASLGALALFAPWVGAVVWWPRLGIVGLWGGLVVWMTVRAFANVVRARSVARGSPSRGGARAVSAG